MESIEVHVHTGRALVTDVTSQVSSFCQRFGDGLVSLFLPHATAGLALMELGSGSEEDLASALERLLPRSEGYAHSHGSRGHGRDHLLPVAVSPSMVLPVINGRVQLGTWQSIVIVDSNVDNPQRRMRLSFVPA